MAKGKITHNKPMELSLEFHKDGPTVSSIGCKIEETFKNLRECYNSGGELPELIIEVNDIHIVGPLIWLLIKYAEIAAVTSIKTRNSAVSCNVKTINLLNRNGFHVNVIAVKPRF